MDWLWNLELIHFFEFYLALMWLLSTYVRARQYLTILRLVRDAPERWPRLLKLVSEHKAVFLTLSTALPLILAAVLLLLHTLACRLVWPNARLFVGDFAHLKAAIVPVGVSALAMLGVDGYATFRVGKIDRQLLDGYFDQAEYWLRSWVAPVVRVFTFGYINPRRMVAVEVRKALVQVSQLLNSTLWWVTTQVSLRIAFGLSLWLTWAWSLRQAAVDF